MVTIVILLPALLALAALAVNLAYIQVVHTKVQVVTDAAVRAAGNAYVASGQQSQALAAAQRMASLNPIESTVLSISSSDLEFGLSQRSGENQAYVFNAAGNGNSVRLTTQTFSSGAGAALRPFFPIMGVNFDIRPVCTATHTQSTLDVCLIVDRSGSMAYAANERVDGISLPAAASAGWLFGNHVPPLSRWLDLVTSVEGFCAELDDTAKVETVGLCSYSSTSRRDADLTSNYSTIMAELNSISEHFDGGATNIGDGIADGIAAVLDPLHARPWANQALVLMSDGNHNTGSDPIAAAGQAASLGIPIYTVSFSQEADDVLMQQIADMTGGTHYHAINAAQLNAAFRAIARNLPSLLTQ